MQLTFVGLTTLYLLSRYHNLIILRRFSLETPTQLPLLQLKERHDWFRPRKQRERIRAVRLHY